MAPVFITVDKTNIYISDQNSIFVFSLNELQLLRRFSQKGQGPGEFIAPPQIKSYPGGILAFIGTKFVWFTKNGEIIKEKTRKKLEIMNNTFKKSISSK